MFCIETYGIAIGRDRESLLLSCLSHIRKTSSSMHHLHSGILLSDWTSIRYWLVRFKDENRTRFTFQIVVSSQKTRRLINTHSIQLTLISLTSLPFFPSSHYTFRKGTFLLSLSFYSAARALTYSNHIALTMWWRFPPDGKKKKKEGKLKTNRSISLPFPSLNRTQLRLSQ